MKNKIKVFYKPWTYGVIENFLSQNEIIKLKKEVLKFNKFDDKVMVNRSRINKGSKNFNELIKKSKSIKNFYEKINSEEFYNEIKNSFNEDKIEWLPDDQFTNFSPNFFGEQKFSLKEKIIKIFSKFNIIKTSMNLDIDFSVSEKGYYRSPHRDRDTRVINFLFYLNNLKEREGGSLALYKAKNKDENQNEYTRFPKSKDIKLVKKIKPKSGRMIIFFSSPNSYHGAERIKSEKTKRVFIYGSYSLNKKVIWKKNQNLNVKKYKSIFA